MYDVLDTLSPEIVVDLLMPVDANWGDTEFNAFVRTLDSIRDVNEWWLCLSPMLTYTWVESAEVY